MKSVFLGLALVFCTSIAGFSQTEQVITPSNVAVKENSQTESQAKIFIQTGKATKKFSINRMLVNQGLKAPIINNSLFNNLQRSAYERSSEKEPKKSKGILRLSSVVLTIVVARLLD